MKHILTPRLQLNKAVTDQPSQEHGYICISNPEEMAQLMEPISKGARFSPSAFQAVVRQICELHGIKIKEIFSDNIIVVEEGDAYALLTRELGTDLSYSRLDEAAFQKIKECENQWLHSLETPLNNPVERKLH